MKAFVISEYAHPSKIQLTPDAPEPILTPGSDDLLVDVHSAGLNFFDVRFPFPRVSYTCISSYRNHRLMQYNVDTAVSGKISNAAATSVCAWRRVRRDSRGCATREPIQARRARIWECTGCVRRARRRQVSRCAASTTYAFVCSGCRCVTEECENTCDCLMDKYAQGCP
jgi:hypothetical protein